MADQNFVMHSGDTKSIAVTVTDSSGNSVNLAGSTVVWTVSDDDTPFGSAQITKQTGGSGITVSSNVATITLDASDTASLAGTFYHELQITDTSSNVSTAMSGYVTIQEDLT